jgi:hypothetical protein
MTITPKRRAARLLLGWSASKLALRVGVGEGTILAFEARDQWLPPLDLNLARERLEAAGIEFIAEDDGGVGVRLRK